MAPIVNTSAIPSVQSDGDGSDDNNSDVGMVTSMGGGDLKDRMEQFERAVEGQAHTLKRTADWFRDQIRGLETFIGIVKREATDCRLKLEREIDYEAKEYPENFDAQIRAH